MLKRRMTSLPLLGLILLLFAASPSHAIVGTFVGGDAGEGLDLDGTFNYAVNVQGPGGFTIRDATFTADNAPGITRNAGNSQIANWATPNLGASANDNNLETVMQSIRHHGQPAGGFIGFDVAGLTAGQEYKVQMLFTESCCNTRNFDVLVDGVIAANDFNPSAVQGATTNTPTNGAVVTETFFAGSASANLFLEGRNQPAGDRNPILSGFTVEELDRTNVALGKSVVASSTFNGTFVGNNITDGNTNDAQGNQWLGAQGVQQANLVIDLDGEFDLTQLRLLNTGNAQFLDRSTGEFSIDAAGTDGIFSNVVGPMVLQANSEGFFEINVDLSRIQFLRYNMLSIADPPGGIAGAAGGGLNEIQAIGTAFVPEPTTALLGLLGLAGLARRRRNVIHA